MPLLHNENMETKIELKFYLTNMTCMIGDKLYKHEKCIKRYVEFWFLLNSHPFS